MKIENAINYVKLIFAGDCSGHDLYHTMRVYRLSMQIAEQENADMLTVQLAALLHDVDDAELFPETHETKKNAVDFMRSNGVDDKIMDSVCRIIDEVSFAGIDSVVPGTIEGKCVQDADRLDAMGAIGIARAFAYGGSKGRKIYDPDIKPLSDRKKEEYHRNQNSTSINHFYEKLLLLKDKLNTEAAKKIAEHRHAVMEAYLKEFMAEWEGNGTSPLMQPQSAETYLQTEEHLYSRMQSAAKQTMEYIKKVIKPGINLCDIRKACEEKLLESGADSFWYWDVGALVFAGDETTISVSGKQYKTADRAIGSNDIITIDLSPQAGNIWGDYARTIIVENGKVVDNMELIEELEWKRGLQMEDELHTELFRFATKETTFEELYYHMNKFIVEKGFVNLDFMGNLGHSIVKTKGDRIYIEKGNTTKLGDVKYFTFEPHIAFPDSKYGFKKENIYYFDADRLAEL